MFIISRSASNTTSPTQDDDWSVINVNTTTKLNESTPDLEEIKMVCWSKKKIKLIMND